MAFRTEDWKAACVVELSVEPMVVEQVDQWAS